MKSLLDNKDDVFLHFQEVIKPAPDQIIRYSLEADSEPLWIKGGDRPELIPCCDKCGKQLKFEFQIMPQVLAVLKETRLGENVCRKLNVSDLLLLIPFSTDWGTICVYTCRDGCSALANHNYRSEFVWIQPAP